jgi:zinc protease
MSRAFSRWLWGCVVAGVAMSAVQAGESPVVGVRVPAFERVVLGNGATLLLMERHDIPLVGFQAILRGGALGDAAGKWGTASLLAGLLEKGAGKRDAYAFADASAAVGGTIGADAGLEAVTVSGEFLARDQALMIELLADMLQRPRLDAAEFEKLRERQIEFIRAAKDGDLSAILPTYGAAALFKDHPYARPVSGSETSLATLTHADVTAYYREQVGADRLIIAMTGDFRSADMKKRLTDAFGGWAKAKAPVPVAPAPAKVKGRQVLLVDAPGAAQTYFLIANVGVNRKYASRAPLDVVNTLFGGRFTSMLNSELRIKSGLTYGARSQLVRPTQPGQWQIATYTRTDATVQAADLALETFGKFRQGGAIDATALDSGKTYVLGQFPTQLETSPQWARQLAELEFYGLDRSYVEGYGPALAAVSLADAARVTAEVYPSADDLVFVFIGDAAKIRDGIRKYGPLTEMKLTDPAFSP